MSKINTKFIDPRFKIGVMVENIKPLGSGGVFIGYDGFGKCLIKQENETVEIVEPEFLKVVEVDNKKTKKELEYEELRPRYLQAYKRFNDGEEVEECYYKNGRICLSTNAFPKQITRFTIEEFKQAINRLEAGIKHKEEVKRADLSDLKTVSGVNVSRKDETTLEIKFEGLESIYVDLETSSRLSALILDQLLHPFPIIW